MNGNKVNNYTAFTIHTNAFLTDVVINCASKVNNGGFNMGINCLKGYLCLIAERASEINDPKLNELMCRMALYAIADPYDENYDREAVKRVYKKTGFKYFNDVEKCTTVEGGGE